MTDTNQRNVNKRIIMETFVLYESNLIVNLLSRVAWMDVVVIFAPFFYRKTVFFYNAEYPVICDTTRLRNDFL